MTQRCREIVLKPSTRRNREASVNWSSGEKTAQRTCVHPCPSVGLHARSIVSAGGHCFIRRSSGPALGHKRQSWFCHEDCQMKEQDRLYMTYYRGFQGLFILAKFAIPLVNRRWIDDGTDRPCMSPETALLALDNLAEWPGLVARKALDLRGDRRSRRWRRCRLC